MNEQGVAQSARASAVRQEARHLLFLSHAGVDAEAALRLADRIEATPEAREHGLKVWVDKRDLEAGSGWQQQLEQAIEERSTAFAVYLGATGIINWVDSEVRVALSRARSDPNYRFIPIISASAEGSGALPGFARQYQGVLDVENRPEELAKLIRAALGAEADAAGAAGRSAVPGSARLRRGAGAPVLRPRDRDRGAGREAAARPAPDGRGRQRLRQVVPGPGRAGAALSRRRARRPVA